MTTTETVLPNGQDLAAAIAEGRRAYELDRKHVFHSWSAQAQIKPMTIVAAEGSTRARRPTRRLRRPAELGARASLRGKEAQVLPESSPASPLGSAGVTRNIGKREAVASPRRAQAWAASMPAWP